MQSTFLPRDFSLEQIEANITQLIEDHDAHHKKEKTKMGVDRANQMTRIKDKFKEIKAFIHLVKILSAENYTLEEMKKKELINDTESAVASVKRRLVPVDELIKLITNQQKTFQAQSPDTLISLTKKLIRHYKSLVRFMNEMGISPIYLGEEEDPFAKIKTEIDKNIKILTEASESSYLPLNKRKKIQLELDLIAKYYYKKENQEQISKEQWELYEKEILQIEQQIAFEQEIALQEKNGDRTKESPPPTDEEKSKLMVELIKKKIYMSKEQRAGLIRAIAAFDQAEQNKFFDHMNEGENINHPEKDLDIEDINKASDNKHLFSGLELSMDPYYEDDFKFHLPSHSKNPNKDIHSLLSIDQETLADIGYEENTIRDQPLTAEQRTKMLENWVAIELTRKDQILLPQELYLKKIKIQKITENFSKEEAGQLRNIFVHQLIKQRLIAFMDQHAKKAIIAFILAIKREIKKDYQQEGYKQTLLSYWSSNANDPNNSFFYSGINAAIGIPDEPKRPNKPTNKNNAQENSAYETKLIEYEKNLEEYNKSLEKFTDEMNFLHDEMFDVLTAFNIAGPKAGDRLSNKDQTSVSISESQSKILENITFDDKVRDEQIASIIKWQFDLKDTQREYGLRLLSEEVYSELLKNKSVKPDKPILVEKKEGGYLFLGLNEQGKWISTELVELPIPIDWKFAKDLREECTVWMAPISINPEKERIDLPQEIVKYQEIFTILGKHHIQPVEKPSILSNDISTNVQGLLAAPLHFNLKIKQLDWIVFHCTKSIDMGNKDLIKIRDRFINERERLDQELLQKYTPTSEISIYNSREKASLIVHKKCMELLTKTTKKSLPHEPQPDKLSEKLHKKLKEEITKFDKELYKTFEQGIVIEGQQVYENAKKRLIECPNDEMATKIIANTTQRLISYLDEYDFGTVRASSPELNFDWKNISKEYWKNILKNWDNKPERWQRLTDENWNTLSDEYWEMLSVEYFRYLALEYWKNLPKEYNRKPAQTLSERSKNERSQEHWRQIHKQTLASSTEEKAWKNFNGGKVKEYEDKVDLKLSAENAKKQKLNAITFFSTHVKNKINSLRKEYDDNAPKEREAASLKRQ